jgi:hypothetical protein
VVAGFLASQVGVAQQVVGAVDVALHAGDAHVAPRVQLAAVDHERLAQPLQDPVDAGRRRMVVHNLADGACVPVGAW